MPALFFETFSLIMFFLDIVLLSSKLIMYIVYNKLSIGPGETDIFVTIEMYCFYCNIHMSL